MLAKEVRESKGCIHTHKHAPCTPLRHARGVRQPAWPSLAHAGCSSGPPAATIDDTPTCMRAGSSYACTAAVAGMAAACVRTHAACRRACPRLTTPSPALASLTCWRTCRSRPAPAPCLRQVGGVARVCCASLPRATHAVAHTRTHTHVTRHAHGSTTTHPQRARHTSCARHRPPTSAQHPTQQIHTHTRSGTTPQHTHAHATNTSRHRGAAGAHCRWAQVLLAHLQEWPQSDDPHAPAVWQHVGLC
jgi:hypothetical protein